MFVGLPVEQKPKGEPHKSECAGEDERRAPAPVLRDPWHDERSDDGAGVCAGVEDSGGEGALFFGEPFGDALDAGGKNAGFTESERETRSGKAGEGTCGGVGHGRKAPEGHGERVADARTETIDEAAHEQHACRIGDLKIRDEVTVLNIVPAEVVLQRGFQHAEDLAIDVVFRYAEKEERADHPAEITYASRSWRARSEEHTSEL